jgi:hypothetical protein
VNSAGSILATSQSSGTTNETINYTVTPGTYYARVYGANTNTFNATSCYTLKVALGTATRLTDLYTENNVEVYPNPAQHAVYIRQSGLTGRSVIHVYDVNGAEMMNKVATKEITSFDISALPSGIYMIKVINNDKIISRSKIIKQ